ncbi:hypothetical protein COY52_11460 [Candidatus Desantisbacteria bacterium CG_4_10_14_0_8_um_filter_48_22]|uniref:Uncharacterized protein n=1 Tax=Candidatus Desantisbacteria bacterium CG_4_10_14_0_8_um_filter_48_22 TaxID=1974543 RepID=A0A2M7S567_9BACT|nr:MAG: hypothetical protein AUJ67_06925 [Candidatus Desantisbacteria bacterium CG1_02_49_89]PIV56571.1 MAG: hypothetical protein COS16_03525 [Candidatus Desantisbacteria bacterium CG02_land_8_20_14_3_00_49_13]PIZ14692.1 MAG: hypothetical protein COY52_11460 [Candidatus Desantisbacteria bacterium CG_4_10_14_0_8_um_filter_48_22]
MFIYRENSPQNAIEPLLVQFWAYSSGYFCLWGWGGVKRKLILNNRAFGGGLRKGLPYPPRWTSGRAKDQWDKKKVFIYLHLINLKDF